MRIVQHPYIDRNSPGTMTPLRGEREPEPPGEAIDVGPLPPRLEALARRTPYRPSEELLLPPERFSDEPATPWHGQRIGAPTAPEKTREHSLAVASRLGFSCAGWPRRPSSVEFYEAVRGNPLTERQVAILDTWATEANWPELMAAWTQHAYTFRELVTALHRAGLVRCRAAASLNRWAT